MPSFSSSVLGPGDRFVLWFGGAVLCQMPTKGEPHGHCGGPASVPLCGQLESSAAKSFGQSRLLLLPPPLRALDSSSHMMHIFLDLSRVLCLHSRFGMFLTKSGNCSSDLEIIRPFLLSRFGPPLASTLANKHAQQVIENQLVTYRGTSGRKVAAAEKP